MQSRIADSLDYLRVPGEISPKDYFSKWGFFNQQVEDYVDVGAYVGDSLERFIWSVNGIFSKIYAFEPHPLMFEACKHRVERLIREWALSVDNIELHNVAVFDQNEDLFFSNFTTSSMLAQNSLNLESNKEIKISSIVLDEFFDERRVSLIKIDAEGSEHQIIAGAKKLIHRCLPKIAIAVYHYPTDIFDIPEKIISISPSYEFRLDHLASSNNELILFCSNQGI
jgi:FkbM family methyltransferase